MQEYVLKFDGSCGPTNPGGMGAYGFIVYHKSFDWEKKIHDGYGKIGQWPEMTNNYAEFFALSKGLEYLNSIIDTPCLISIKGDSDLTIKIMSKQWKARPQRGYYDAYILAKKEVNLLLNKGCKIRLKWIPREQNEDCDILSKKYLTD